jgi:hypothetical protein
VPDEGRYGTFGTEARNDVNVVSKDCDFMNVNTILTCCNSNDIADLVCIRPAQAALSQPRMPRDVHVDPECTVGHRTQFSLG